MSCSNIYRKIFRRKLTILSASIIVFFIVVGLLAPFLAPHDPTLSNIKQKLEPPSWQYPLGTDHLGRCILSRLIYAIPYSLGTAFLVMLFTVSMGALVGILAGYRGGVTDQVFMRFCDIFLAFPNLVLILAIVGMLGPGLLNVLIAASLVQWVWYARMIRGMVLGVKQQNYILAAKVSGTPGWTIVCQHILPSIAPQIVILATLDIGWIILSISGLSFLGLGIQPPTPEWGTMLNDGRQFLRSSPMLMVYPGMMILLAVTAFNLLGDALRDALDPQGDYTWREKLSSAQD